MYINTLSN